MKTISTKHQEESKSGGVQCWQQQHGDWGDSSSRPPTTRPARPEDSSTRPTCGRITAPLPSSWCVSSLLFLLYITNEPGAIDSLRQGMYTQLLNAVGFSVSQNCADPVSSDAMVHGSVYIYEIHVTNDEFMRRDRGHGGGGNITVSAKNIMHLIKLIEVYTSMISKRRLNFYIRMGT